MDAHEILKKVRRIEIRTKELSRHLFGGAYHSVFKGKGMSFSEVREYTLGDDVRYIDWNVTARTGQTFLKVFEEERELTLMLLIDISRSMRFGSLERDKQYWVTEIAAVLAFSAAQNHDKVGLILFSDRVHLYLAPKKGRHHILRIIRELLNYRPEAKRTDLEAPLQYMDRVQHKRCICFLISDFHAALPERSLRVIGKRHEIIGIELLDPLEQMFPGVGLVYFTDAETGENLLVNTDNEVWRNEFVVRQQHNSKKLKQEFIKAKAGILSLPLNEGYVKALLNYFKKRVRQ